MMMVMLIIIIINITNITTNLLSLSKYRDFYPIITSAVATLTGCRWHWILSPVRKINLEACALLVSKQITASQLFKSKHAMYKKK